MGVALKVQDGAGTCWHRFRQNLIMKPKLILQKFLLVNNNEKHRTKVTRPMVPITAGLLKDANIDALKEFAESIWKVTYSHILSPGQIRYMLDRLYHPDLLREQVTSGNPLFGAYSGEQLVGFAHVFVEGHQSRLDKLYVETLFQGSGIGRKLVDQAVTFAIESDCSLMTLRVNRNNVNAVAAYEKLGFGIVATHKKDIGGGYVMDDYLMLMDLVPQD